VPIFVERQDYNLCANRTSPSTSLYFTLSLTSALLPVETFSAWVLKPLGVTISFGYIG
jgi:hypothetical protein